ncbi:MAG: hypothetical protein SFX74_06980 [Fimbriimonadaceae bacterium]|nr:hypothetical protein [Fimbriimonadaceae bacterium]
MLAAVLAAGQFGCGTPDTDPGAKINAPGYYNGPMEKRRKGQDTGSDDSAPQGKAENLRSKQ